MEHSAANISILADEIISGRRLTRDEDLSFFLECGTEDLCEGATRIRAALGGKRADLCSIINARSGRCSEDCKYCAQSAYSRTGCEEYEFLPPEEVYLAAAEMDAESVDRFSVVTSGRALSGKEFERALEAYRLIHEKLGINLCASMGFLTAEQFRSLRSAGVTRYHDNLETSRRFFPEICTTHTYDQKIETIRTAQAEGLSVCSGGIIGMGETWEDRIDLALTLSELGIKSIPINVLNAVPGTPLENMPALGEEEILRTVAIFRFIDPEAHVRLAGGRILVEGFGKKAFLSGANAAITGNMLTTTGATVKKDREMLTELGFELRDC